MASLWLDGVGDEGDGVDVIATVGEGDGSGAESSGGVDGVNGEGERRKRTCLS